MEFSDTDTHIDRLSEFLEEHYSETLQNIANRECKDITISLELLFESRICVPQEWLGETIVFANASQLLADAIPANTRKFQKLFANLCYKILPKPTKTFRLDVIDQFLDECGVSNLPPELVHRFDVFFQPLIDMKARKISDIKSKCIGRLVVTQGVINHIAEPEFVCKVAAYYCSLCSTNIFQPVASLSYNPIIKCPSTACRLNKSRGSIYQTNKGSKFRKLIRLKVQEDSDGGQRLPAQLTVWCWNLPSVRPGDRVQITGVTLPIIRNNITTIYVDAHRY